MEKLVRIIDLETTGVDPDKDAIVEVAALDWTGEPPCSLHLNQLVKPPMKIPPVCSSITHLTDADVYDQPEWRDVKDKLEGADIYCAHRAAFDKSFLPDLAGKYWICTWKVALKAWPDLDSHALQFVRYSLKIGKPPEELGAMPHRAAYDAWCCAEIFQHALDSTDMTVKDMVILSAQPAVLSKLPFGKHAGEHLSKVPESYLEWLAGSADKFDEDIIHTANHWLAKRRGRSA